MIKEFNGIQKSIKEKNMDPLPEEQAKKEKEEMKMCEDLIKRYPKWMRASFFKIGEDPECLSRDEIEKWEVKVQDITGSEEEPLIIDIARKKTPSRSERFIEENEKNKASVQSDNPVDSRDTEEKERIIKKCNQYYLKQQEILEKTGKKRQDLLSTLLAEKEAIRDGQRPDWLYKGGKIRDIEMCQHETKGFPKWLKEDALQIGEDPDCLSRDEIKKWKVKVQDITGSKEEPLILDIARRKTQSENLEEKEKKEEENKQKEAILNLLTFNIRRTK